MPKAVVGAFLAAFRAARRSYTVHPWCEKNALSSFLLPIRRIHVCGLIAVCSPLTASCGGAKAGGPLGGDGSLVETGTDAESSAGLESGSGSTSDSAVTSIGEVGNGEEDVMDGPVDVRGDVWCEGPPCPTPIFTPAGGKIPATAVTITVPGLPKAVIHYTTDGTLPSSISPIYGGPIFVVASETIRAFAVLACVCTDSNIAAATYSV